MRLKLITQAVSWKTRRIKVAGEWASVDPDINLLQIRVGKEQEMEVINALDGGKAIEKVYE